ncbi:hypothetical protein D9M68_830610 [compost metagenome]
MAVAVEVHRVGAKAAWHELRQAHGAGVGAFQAERVDLFLARQHEELAQLLAEERRTRRIVEGQRRQRIDYAVAAGVAAIEGLHADDRDDHLGRHAVLLFGTFQRLFVLTPEIHTAGDTRVGDKDRPVVFPWLDLLRRTRDRVEDRLLAFHLGEQVDQLLTGKPVVASHLGDELSHLRRVLVISGDSLLSQSEHPGQT